LCIESIYAQLEACSVSVDASGVYAYLKGPVDSQHRVCQNDGKVPHVWEGSFIAFGDILLKAGEGTAKALGMYETAKNAPNFGEWPYQRELQDRIDNVEQNAERWADKDPLNDPPIWLLAGHVCSGCHQRSK
jgi:hypothetical protein